MSQANAAPAIERWFNDYAHHHQTRGNKVCHSVGIPLIVIALFGLLAGVHFGPLPGLEEHQRWVALDGGLGLLALAMLWYLLLDWRLALPFGLFGVGLYWIGRALPLPVLWIAFGAGWIFQGVGHRVYEKNSPAFFSNVRHLLIGPFWLFATWIRYPRPGDRTV